MTDHDTLADRRRALEEEYFRKRDKELVEKMRRAAEAEQARGEISRKTGLSDPALLQELLDLGFTPDTVVLLPLVPVIEVAWAEGGITASERDLIVALARSRGINEGDAADRQLQLWMENRPEPVVFERAGRLISAMLSTGGETGRGMSADDLVAYCEKIAAASGGIFGTRLRSITGEERSILTRIAADLKGRRA